MHVSGPAPTMPRNLFKSTRLHKTAPSARRYDAHGEQDGLLGPDQDQTPFPQRVRPVPTMRDRCVHSLESATAFVHADEAQPHARLGGDVARGHGAVAELLPQLADQDAQVVGVVLVGGAP